MHGEVYCTVRFTTVVWVTVPEVAWMVTFEVPVGVDGRTIGLVVEQPTKNAAEKIRTPSRPKSRRERCWLVDLRRERVRSAPKGRRKAAVIPAVAAPRRVEGWRLAVGFAVLNVTVVVAGAPEVTDTVAGEKKQVAATGRPEQRMFALPLKLLVGTRLTTAVVEEPAETVRAEVEVLMPKVGAPVAVGLVLTAARRPCFSESRPAVK